MKKIMDKIRALLSDREKIRELVLYVFFGVMTTAVNWVVYLLITWALGMENHAEGSAGYVMISNVSVLIMSAFRTKIAVILYTISAIASIKESLLL